MGRIHISQKSGPGQYFSTVILFTTHTKESFQIPWYNLATLLHHLRPAEGVKWCLSWCPCHCDRMPWHKQLKVQSMVVGSHAAGMGLTGHVVSAVCRKQNNECLVVCAQLTFSILYGSESPTQRMTLPTTEMDLLMSMTIIKKIPQACPEATNTPHRHDQRHNSHTGILGFISQVILEPVKVTKPIITSGKLLALGAWGVIFPGWDPQWLTRY